MLYNITSYKIRDLMQKYELIAIEDLVSTRISVPNNLENLRRIIKSDGIIAGSLLTEK